jgi:hypothetical protein
MAPEHVAGVIKFVIDNLQNFRIRNITLHKWRHVWCYGILKN